MIQTIRGWSEHFIFKVILGLTAFSFVAAFGAGGFLSFLTDDKTVLSTSKDNVRAIQFAEDLQSEMRRVEKRFSSALEIKDFIRSGFGRSYAQMVLDKMTLAAFAKDAGIDFSTQQIAYLIQRDPAFQDASGVYNRAILDARLADLNMNEAAFVDHIRDQAIQQQILSAPISQSMTSRQLSELLFYIRREKRAFDYVHIPFDKVSVTGKPGTAALREIYEEQRENFYYPEYRSVQVLDFPSGFIMNRLSVAEKDMKAHYDLYQEDYLVPEKRRVGQLIFKAEKEAEDFIRAYQSGMKIADIDKNLPLNSVYSDLGLIQEDEISPLLAEPAFVAAKGEVVGPIEIDTDYQVLIVRDIQKERQLSFDSVKDVIKEKLQRERLDDVYLQLYQDIDNMLAEGVFFDDIAKHFGIAVRTLDRIVYGDTRLPAALVQEIFDLDAGMETSLAEYNGGFIAAKLTDITPQRLKTFEEARAELTQVWTREQQIKLAAERADALVSSFKGKDIKTQDPSTREELLASYPDDLISSVFTHRSTKDVHKIPVSDGIFVYKLKNIKEADLSGQQIALGLVQGLLLENAKDEFSEAFMEDLRQHYDARIDEKVLSDILSRLGYLSAERE